MRLLYICLGYCLVPIVLGIQLWRGLRDRSQSEGLGERLGFGAALPPDGIWVHAVSVGEVQAAAAVVRALRRRFPNSPLLVTTSTATGRAMARRLFGGGVPVRYLPYDLPGAVRRFLVRARPRIAIVLETELWPNLYRACAARDIPIVIANARLSARSVGRYQRLPGLVRDTLGRVTLIAAQSDADAERFARLGAPAGRIHVIGNLKFDAALPEDVATLGLALRKALGRGRPVWVAGSTHEGEEEMLLTVHAALRKSVPSALLVLVPRHPPRFGAVEALLRQRGEVYVTRRGGGLVGAGTGVLLVDTLGELVAFYAAADAAFVGGSLVPIGGHNLLEPAALGKPILTGPHTQNAAAIAQSLIDAGAATVVDDAAAIESRLRTFLLNPRAARTAGAAGLGVVATSGGALERLLALIEPHLAGRSPT